MINIMIAPDWEKVLEEHKHHIGTHDIEGDTITRERLIAWAKDPNREYYCIYDGSPPVIEDNGFMYCSTCGDYEGLSPNCNP